MAANRVYGDLYRDYGPSRDPTTNHYVSTQTWPWPRLPPFLGPSFLLFSSDTLPRLLQVLPQVPPLPLWEVWLSGLVTIKAEVLRIGVKDFFGHISRKVGITDFFLTRVLFRRSISFHFQAPPCSWLHFGAITGVSGAPEEKLLNSKLLRGTQGNCSISQS